MSFVSTVSSTIPITHSVTYSCAFNNNWSSQNHPVQYPSDAHWSWPVIAAHSENYSMWAPGGMASSGVERVAETGQTGTLLNEIRTAQNNNSAGDYVRGIVTFNSDRQSQTFDDITLTPWFDRMSSITMVAPSPDWFTGFYDIRPVDDSSNVWLQSFEIATQPWDAGTEMGQRLSCNNDPEDPHLPIMEFTTATVPNSGIFLNQAGNDVLPLATWTCTLQTSVCADNTEVCGSLGTARARRGVRRLKKAKARKNAKRVKKAKASERTKQCRERIDGQTLSTWCPSACGVCGGEN